jgi:hypothetical protein
VAFVDRELGHVSARAISTHSASTVMVVPSDSSFDRLRRFINHNRQRRYSRPRGFIDSRCERISFKQRLWRFRMDGSPVLGYIADGEYWILDKRFEEAVGGSREATALKKELFSRGLIATDKRGEGVSYVVKRPLPDGSRQFFVVIRNEPKRS